MSVFLYFIAAWNLATFIIMGIDKQKARHNRWRISERFLFSTALCFGALGMYLGMKFFHHKTKHPLFKVGIPILLLLQVGFGVWLLFYHNP